MSERASRVAPVALVLLLALGLLPSADVLRMAGAPDAAEELIEVLDGLPSDPVVLVGFDPDLGTYAEIRPAVRALLDELLARDATLVFVSLTPEGRALAIAEQSRLLALGAGPERIVDTGFVPGAEAALVALSRSIEGGGRGLVGALPEAPITLGLVIGGNDIGPRSWVEQLAPRVEGIELIAVAPSVLLPELVPYLESGQLRALLATPRDGAAFRAAVEPAELGDVGGPRPVAVLLGMLAAIGVLGVAVVSRLGEALRSSRGREAA